jgi:hypothetical protein
MIFSGTENFLEKQFLRNWLAQQGLLSRVSQGTRNASPNG